MASQTALKDEHELELLIALRFAIIAVETQEEQRAVELLKRCGSRLGLPVFTWSITGGWKSTAMQVPLTTPLDPASALRHVAQVRQPGAYVLLDFHPFLGDPLHVRLLKEIAVDYDRVPRTPSRQARPGCGGLRPCAPGGADRGILRRRDSAHSAALDRDGRTDRRAARVGRRQNRSR